MVKFKKGKVYKISFMDHSSFESMEEATPYRCVAYGLVSDVENSHIIVQSWITYENNGDVALCSTGGYVIMRRDIDTAVLLNE